MLWRRHCSNTLYTPISSSLTYNTLILRPSTTKIAIDSPRYPTLFTTAREPTMLYAQLVQVNHILFSTVATRIYHIEDRKPESIAKTALDFGLAPSHFRRILVFHLLLNLFNNRSIPFGYLLSFILPYPSHHIGLPTPVPSWCVYSIILIGGQCSSPTSLPHGLSDASLGALLAIVGDIIDFRFKISPPLIPTAHRYRLPYDSFPHTTMSKGEKYPVLPLTNDNFDSKTGHTLTVVEKRVVTRPATWALLALPFMVYLVHSTCRHGVSSKPPFGLPNEIQHQWGPYSPWFPVGKYQSPPKECQIVQVNVLHRHGARYPTEDDEYDTSVKKLTSARKYRDHALQFLEDYEYTLGEEELLPFGALQSFESGQTVYERYSKLVSAENLPFVRATDKPRVFYSAGNWSTGFAAASGFKFNPGVAISLPESQNNTLKENCPNSPQGRKQKDEWLSVFAPPIAKRLNKAAPGTNLTDDDIFNLMCMCPFESTAKERASKFCKLFTKKEFEAFEYHGDVEKYYKTGYGEPLGPVQGVGYINELLARLTGMAVVDRTTHNASYPFPLDRSIYVDFTHENLMVAVYSAMGLFNISSHPLNTNEISNRHGWIASRMVPLSARMVVEKLQCARHDAQKGEFVRIFVNDALQPLEFCGVSRRKDGLCELDAFVESQGYARRSGDGDFEKCYN